MKQERRNLKIWGVALGYLVSRFFSLWMNSFSRSEIKFFITETERSRLLSKEKNKGERR